MREARLLVCFVSQVKGTILEAAPSASKQLLIRNFPTTKKKIPPRERLRALRALAETCQHCFRSSFWIIYSASLTESARKCWILDPREDTLTDRLSVEITKCCGRKALSWNHCLNWYKRVPETHLMVIKKSAVNWVKIYFSLLLSLSVKGRFS